MPVPDAPAAPPAQPAPPPGDAAPSAPPAPPQDEPTQALRYEPVPPEPSAPGAPAASGSAADETRRLIEELSAGQTPQLASSWTPQPPQGSGVFPPSDVPSYTPTPPAPLPSDLSHEGGLPSTPAPRAVYDEPQRTEPEHSDRSRSRLLPLLLALALLLGGGYLLKNLLSGDDDTDAAPVPVRRSPAASAAPSAQATYSAAQLAASLKDPHFRHGYDYGKKLAAAGPVADAEAACRTQALKERAAGYPWGAHDRQGCLVGSTA